MITLSGFHCLDEFYLHLIIKSNRILGVYWSEVPSQPKSWYRRLTLTERRSAMTSTPETSNGLWRRQFWTSIIVHQCQCQENVNLSRNPKRRPSFNYLKFSMGLLMFTAAQVCNFWQRQRSIKRDSFPTPHTPKLDPKRASYFILSKKVSKKN